LEEGDRATMAYLQGSKQAAFWPTVTPGKGVGETKYQNLKNDLQPIDKA